jgi:aromatic-L-amino-acid decarboxylase
VRVLVGEALPAATAATEEAAMPDHSRAAGDGHAASGSAQGEPRPTELFEPRPGSSLDPEGFRRYGHEVIDWVADYLRDVSRYPVLPPIEPGDIRRRLPGSPPQTGEPMEAILRDFREIVLPGVTHWNHPRFFAYFPANHSGPSILGEILSAALGVNGMVWQSCPAATELEEVVMDWLRQLLDLPETFRGVIQDTASTATLCALLCARERVTGFGANRDGCFESGAPLRVYASSEAHSSVEKGARIAGFGSENLVQVGVDETLAMDPADLEARIRADLAQGPRPCCVVATVGTTSSTAMDPLGPIAEVAARHGLWMHVDAALAGSAAILPEKRAILEGVERVDSFSFNPHKWLFTNFDCSAFFCRHPETLIRTFAINPEYLKTSVDQQVTNYRDWGIALGRRFRALKLWFVLRQFGAEGLRARLREHLALAQEFKAWVESQPEFELLAPVPLNTVCFRYNPGGLAEPELDQRNARLLERVNASGRIFMTHTKLRGCYCLRVSIGQTQTRRVHIREAEEAILAGLAG